MGGRCACRAVHQYRIATLVAIDNLQIRVTNIHSNHDHYLLLEINFTTTPERLQHACTAATVARSATARPQHVCELLMSEKI